MGNPVQFNGSHKRANDILMVMEQVAALLSGGRDWSGSAQSADSHRGTAGEQLSGYVFVKGSSSCGYQPGGLSR